MCVFVGSVGDVVVGCVCGIDCVVVELWWNWYVVDCVCVVGVVGVVVGCVVYDVWVLFVDCVWIEGYVDVWLGCCVVWLLDWFWDDLVVGCVCGYWYVCGVWGRVCCCVVIWLFVCCVLYGFGSCIVWLVCVCVCVLLCVWFLWWYVVCVELCGYDVWYCVGVWWIYDDVCVCCGGNGDWVDFGGSG